MKAYCLNEVGLNEYKHLIEDARNQGKGVIKLTTAELQMLYYTAATCNSKVEEMQKTLEFIREQIPCMQDDGESPNMRHNIGNMIMHKIDQAMEE